MAGLEKMPFSQWSIYFLLAETISYSQRNKIKTPAGSYSGATQKDETVWTLPGTLCYYKSCHTFRVYVLQAHFTVGLKIQQKDLSKVLSRCFDMCFKAIKHLSGQTVQKPYKEKMSFALMSKGLCSRLRGDHFLNWPLFLCWRPLGFCTNDFRINTFTVASSCL